MRELYQTINNLLNKVDYEAIWPGFHKYTFALYDDKQIYFEDKVIPCDERFMGNTCILYNGEYIAIWNMLMTQTVDPEELAACMVHEMFHAYQMESNETRYPDDLILLSYPLDTEKFILKYNENLKLVEAIEQANFSDKLSLLSEFALYRNKREAMLGEFIQCEYKMETVEGMAEYCGTIALKQLNTAKYEERIKSYIEILRNVGNTQFDLRRISYYTGTLFLIALNQMDISFYHTINNTDKTVYELVKDKLLINKLTTSALIHEDLIKTAISATIKEKNCKFEQFFSSNPIKYEVDCYISGYDPMNMIKLGSKVLCTHYIYLTDNKTNERTLIHGPVVVELKDDSYRQVNSYYTNA